MSILTVKLQKKQGGLFHASYHIEVMVSGYDDKVGKEITYRMIKPGMIKDMEDKIIHDTPIPGCFYSEDYVSMESDVTIDGFVSYLIENFGDYNTCNKNCADGVLGTFAYFFPQEEMSCSYSLRKGVGALIPLSCMIEGIIGSVVFMGMSSLSLPVLAASVCCISTGIATCTTASPGYLPGPLGVMNPKEVFRYAKELAKKYPVGSKQVESTPLIAPILSSINWM